MAGSKLKKLGDRDVLSVKDMEFAVLVMQGLGHYEAFMEVYGNPDGLQEATIKVNSKNLLNTDKVKAFIGRVEKKATAFAGMSVAFKRNVLADMVMDKEVAPRDRITAIKVDNDMAGHNAVQKVEHEHKGSVMLDLLDKVRKSGNRIGTREMYSPSKVLELERDKVIELNTVKEENEAVSIEKN